MKQNVVKQQYFDFLTLPHRQFDHRRVIRQERNFDDRAWNRRS